MELENPTNAAIYAQVEKNRNNRACYICGKNSYYSATCQEHGDMEAQMLRMFGLPLDMAPIPCDNAPEVETKP